MTPKQIENFRKVMSMQFGQLAIAVLSDDQIVELRDFIQDAVNADDMDADVRVKLAVMLTENDREAAKRARKKREEGYAYEDKPSTGASWFDKALKKEK